ncbi:MAG: TetR/AcrR family transcriptional regulator [Polyangiales bacterium]
MARSKPRDAVPAKTARAQVSVAKTPEPKATRSTKGARTRERLVEAAKEVFEELGFLEARIADIAERAGQAHGSFYYYFDSKEEIFREVAASVDQRLFAPMTDVILAQSKLAPKQRIQEAMRRHFDSYREEAKILGLIEHVSRYDPEVNKIRLERHARYTEEVAASIRQLQKRKLADPTLDPMLAAAALGSLTYRFAEMWLVHGAVESTMEHAVEQVSQIFINALRLKDV